MVDMIKVLVVHNWQCRAMHDHDHTCAVLAQVDGVHVVIFFNICTVFFISGLLLRTDELRSALTRR